MPAIGIGTYQLYGEDCVRSVSEALRCGFRLVDTAAAYHNEVLVGEGIRQSGIPRAELFIVVKISMRAMRSEDGIRDSILQSLSNLLLSYADVVLMHWPGCHGVAAEDAAGNAAARRRGWKVMKTLQREGRIRFLGVSNFLPRHFAELEDDGVGVVLNQIELHPLCVQSEVRAYCEARGIVLQQYAALGEMDPRLVAHPRLLEVCQRYFPEHTVCEVLLMWGCVQGFCVLVRSRQGTHHRANFRVALEVFAALRGQVAGKGAIGSTETTEVSKKQEPSGKTGEKSSSEGGWTARSLSTEQLEVIRNLRAYLGVTEDVHICWHSAHVA